MGSSEGDSTSADLGAALDAAGEKPPDDGDRESKKNYAQRLSRALAQAVADRLRDAFPRISPCGDAGHEREIGGAGGKKRLDVCVWDDQLGLLLDVSIKTYSFRDYDNKKKKLGRYTKNVVRNDHELRAEAARIHERQPYSVLVGMMFVPFAVCEDGEKEHSSFAHMVTIYRARSGRTAHDDRRLERFEAFYIGLYEASGRERGKVRFFDVMTSPPRNGRPKSSDTLSFAEMSQKVKGLVEARNTAVVDWAEPDSESDGD